MDHMVSSAVIKRLSEKILTAKQGLCAGKTIKAKGEKENWNVTCVFGLTCFGEKNASFIVPA